MRDQATPAWGVVLGADAPRHQQAEASTAVETFSESIHVKGWAVSRPVVPAHDVQAVGDALADSGAGPLRGGVRNLLDLPRVAGLARSEAVRTAAESVLGRSCFAVRGILFDKQPNANWKVPWHQDVTVAVGERRDVEGFGTWSVKAGVPHVQAPVSVLERMIAVRVHLDDCGPENGPLRLLGGSHRGGVLRAEEIDAWVAGNDPETGLAEAGAVLAFRPLLLHASSAAGSPSHRRVVHLDFAACELPGGLRWHWRV